MRAVPFRTSELRSGQVVGRDVYDARTKTVIVRAGFELSDKIIESLQKRNVHCVFIAQGPLEKGDKEVTKEGVALDQSAQAIPEMTELCDQLFGTYESAGAARSQQEMRRVQRRLQRTISGLIDDIREKGVDVAVLLRGEGQGNDLYMHSATVTYQSVLTALRLYPENERAARSVALGALLHDAALAREEFAKGQRDPSEHPQASFELMKEMGFDDPIAGAIIRGHHRNIDGSGYPVRRLEDGNLDRNVYYLAGIVRLAVAYDEATTGKGEGRRLLPVEALYELKRMNEQFQTKLYGREELSRYIVSLSGSERAEDRQLCEEVTKKLRFAKVDLDRKLIKIAEYKRLIFEALPPEYTASLPVASERFGERVLVEPEVLEAFLRVIPPFQLLDEVKLSSGETGIVVGFSPGKPCLPTVRIARQEDGSEVPSGKMKIKMLSGISNERGHLRVVRQGDRSVGDCFYTLRG